MREKLSFPDNFLDKGLPRGYFSASEYGGYKKCGRQYELSYCRNIKVPPGSSMFKGQALHAGVEAALRYKKETNDVPLISVGQVAISDHFKAAKDQNVQWDEKETEETAKQAILLAFAVYHASLISSVHPVEIEQRFIKKIGSVPTLGYIDLIDQVPIGNAAGPTKLVVCDLKYTKQTWSQDKLEKDPQFTLYAIATGIADVRVDNIVHKVKGPEFTQKEAHKTPHDQKVFIEDYEETVELIKKGIFPKASIDSWQCSPEWCGYWNQCRGKE